VINYNIFLIGMMGSGKTTVGKKLSKKLKMNFVDTDYQIESIMSMSISQIFNEFGENRFRAMESSYFIEKSKENGIVFSTGGGIINNKNNRACLLNNGISFFLDTSIEILVKRIENCTKRPLLEKSLNLKKDMLKIWDQRKHYYINCASHIIKTDVYNSDLIVNKITKIINENN
tara:strand:- start:219 stop:740 length:522 start_codon:yes stop_codon:yes gene_type:complete